MCKIYNGSWARDLGWAFQVVQVVKSDCLNEWVIESIRSNMLIHLRMKHFELVNQSLKENLSETVIFSGTNKQLFLRVSHLITYSTDSLKNTD